MPRKTRPTRSFERAGRALEEVFFVEQDRMLIERLRAMKEMAETKEALTEVSGIANDVILTRLVELGVKPEILAALAAVPLVEVAWADGTVDAKERAAVLAHANATGIRPGSIEHELLERWLTHRPEPTMLTAWQSYIKGLCERLSDEEQELLKQELLHATREVAKASGGFLGIGSISASEQEMLDTLAASFRG